MAEKDHAQLTSEVRMVHIVTTDIQVQVILISVIKLSCVASALQCLLSKTIYNERKNKTRCKP